MSYDNMGDPVLELSERPDSPHFNDLSRQVHGVQDLASLLAERVPSTQRGRDMFEAVCALLTDPFNEVALGDTYVLTHPFETASLIRDRLAEESQKDRPANEEAQFRMKALCKVPMRLLEAAQSVGALHGNDGREIFSGYLNWIDDAAESGSVASIHDLMDALRPTLQRAFVKRGEQATIAARISLNQLQKVVAQKLATTTENVQRRFTEGEGWRKSDYYHFDLTDWGPGDDPSAVQRVLFPALDEEAWFNGILKDTKILTGRYGPLEIDELDVLRSALHSSTRPDVLVSVLLARWQRALTEHHRNPLVRERLRAEWEAEMLHGRDGESRQRMEQLLRQPDHLFPERDAESLRIWAMARYLLQFSTKIRPQGSGIAARTYEGWRRAAEAWLQATGGDDDHPDPEVKQFLTNIEALSSDPARIAADFRQPVGVDWSAPFANRGMWQAVFGFFTPNDLMIHMRNPRQERADFPPRTYLVLPRYEGDYSGHLLAVEKDGSFRLLVLENENGSCDEIIPLSRKYLPDVVLRDCLGDLLNCTTCFGLLTGNEWRELTCPSCLSTGRLPNNQLLKAATYDFIRALPKLRSSPPNPNGKYHTNADEQAGVGGAKTFTSHGLREHLANVLSGLTKDTADEVKRPEPQPPASQ